MPVNLLGEPDAREQNDKKITPLPPVWTEKEKTAGDQTLWVPSNPMTLGPLTVTAGRGPGPPG